MLTKSVPASDVKESFAEHVRSVEEREAVVVTRYGRPDDGDELADEVERVVRARPTVRALDDLDDTHPANYSGL